MSDPELADRGQRSAQGDPDAEDELVELAGARGDLVELRRLADAGNSDAAAVLSELLDDGDG